MFFIHDTIIWSLFSLVPLFFFFLYLFFFFFVFVLVDARAGAALACFGGQSSSWR